MIHRLVLCLALTALPASPGRAETVFIKLPFEEKGNGWLFGSRSDESCWLAFPWHLVDSGDIRHTGVRFSDQTGRTGGPVRQCVQRMFRASKRGQGWRISALRR